MKGLLRELGVSIIGGLIVAGIVEVLGSNGHPTDALPGVPSDPRVQFGLVAAVGFTGILLTIRGIKRRRQSLRAANQPAIRTITKQPKQVYFEGEIEKFGILWKGEYGTLREGPFSSIDDAYVYVDGPVCPHDEHDLVSRTVSHWFVFTREVWVCTHCDREYPRPTRHYGNEYDVVEAEMEKMFEDAVEEERKATQ